MSNLTTGPTSDPTTDQTSNTFVGHGVRVEPVEFRGWSAVQLSNGLVEAVVVPDIGGRVMAFDLGGYSYLWVNSAVEGKLYSAAENQGDGSLAAWKNYGGSKTWPAPQGWDTDDQWHGPPDPVLDSGRYRLGGHGIQEGAPFVRVNSPVDPRTGVRITRRFSLAPNGARAVLHLEMENVSTVPRCWSLWDVVQLDATSVSSEGNPTHNDQAWVYIPANAESVFPNGYRVLFGARDNSEWQPDAAPGVIGARYLYQVGKIGVDSQAGWIAFVNRVNDFAFIQRFIVFPEERYPDGGTTVACWTTGLGEAVGGMDYARERLYHVEAEVLGPLRVMQPGESQFFDIEWCACRCPGPVVAVSAAGCCHQRLHAQPGSDGLRVTGIFGVFDPGILRLVWLDDQGIILSEDTIACGSPLEVMRLDALFEPPDSWRRVELVMVNAGGGSIGALDYLERDR